MADNTNAGVGASECCVGELSGDPLDKEDLSEPDECIDWSYSALSAMIQPKQPKADRNSDDIDRWRTAGGIGDTNVIGSEEVKRAEELVILNVEGFCCQVIAAVSDQVCMRGLLDDGCPRLTELPVLSSRRRPRSSPVAAAVRVTVHMLRWTVVVHYCDGFEGWWRWVG